MRIVIDPQGALGGSRLRGIGRYTRSFLSAFAEQAKHHELFVLLNTMLPTAFDTLREDLVGLVPLENFITWSAEAPIGGMHPENGQRRAFAKDVWEEVVASLEPDLLIVSSLFEGAEDDAVCSVPIDRTYPVATICYDLIPLIYSQHYLLHPGMRVHYRRQVNTLASSDFLLAISQSAVDESDPAPPLSAGARDEYRRCGGCGIRCRTGVAARRTVRYHPALSPLCQRLRSQKKPRGADPRLRHASRRTPPTPSARAGRRCGQCPSKLRDVGRECGLEDNELIFTGNVSDDELGSLYGQAKAVAFPSWHEGFGLPILEGNDVWQGGHIVEQIEHAGSCRLRGGSIRSP